MRHIATILALSLSALGAGAGCTANIHDNQVAIDATVDIAASANVDVDNVTPGQAVPVKLSAEGATLVDPKEKVTTDTMSAAYFKVFLDDTSSTELVATASTSVSVTIPPATPPGKHQLVCQLWKHGLKDQPTTQESSLDITVKASASASATTSGNGSASGSASGSATVTVDAGK
jgi:hypothetical protein